MATLEEINTYIRNALAESDPQIVYSELSCYILPECEMVDNKNYYGYDFSSERKVYVLFCDCYSSSFFGLYKPNDLQNARFDECPIYKFDLIGQNNQSKPKLTKIGNFKTLMKFIFLSIPKERRIIFKRAIHDLKNFSNDLIICDYDLKLNN